MSTAVFLSSTAEIAETLEAVATRYALIVIVADGLGDRRRGAVQIIDVGLIGLGPLAARLQSGVVGRTLLRLSPADRGARWRRRVRRTARALRALSEADLVVACERDTVLTAWRAVRSRPAALGLVGTAAGLAELRRRAEGPLATG